MILTVCAAALVCLVHSVLTLGEVRPTSLAATASFFALGLVWTLMAFTLGPPEKVGRFAINIAPAATIALLPLASCLEALVVVATLTMLDGILHGRRRAARVYNVAMCIVATASAWHLAAFVLASMPPSTGALVTATLAGGVAYSLLSIAFSSAIICIAAGQRLKESGALSLSIFVGEAMIDSAASVLSACWITFPPLLLIAATPMTLAFGLLGRVERREVALRDEIVERRRIERELRRARDAAEDSARAKSLFLAHMSHEIRTPMNAIIGMLRLALDDKDGADRRESLEIARDSAVALLGLLNDVLDLSKITSGRIELAPACLRLRTFVSEIVRMYALQARDKGLDLAWRVEEGVPDELLADAGRLRQVLVNLVGNAVKFTERGYVLVDVLLEERRDDSATIILEVHDTGPGIAEADRERIFEPFEQVEGYLTRRHGGTGLGLPIARRLVELMEGSIGVEESREGGALMRVRVTLPRDRAASERASAQSPVAGMRALVLHPSKIVGEALTSQLAHLGVGAIRLSSPGEARALLARSLGRSLRIDALLVHPAEVEALAAAFSELGASSTSEPPPRVHELLSGVRGSELSGEDAARSLAPELERGDSLFLPATPRQLVDVLCGRGASEEPGAAESQPAHAGARRGAASAPGASGGAGTARRPPSAEGEALGYRILLAEDNAVNRKLALRLLERAGHQVVSAVDGRGAFAAWGAGFFDLVLMDVQMPEIDGIRATEMIRESEQESGRRRTPIVALTAHAMEGDRERCLAAGMDGYVTKPIDPTVLNAEIERHVAAARAAQAGAGPEPEREPAPEPIEAR